MVKVVGRKKGSPKALKPSVREIINSRAVDELSTPREKLADSIIEQITGIGETPPTFETTIKYISQARSHVTSELDAPWSIGAAIQHSIPDERLRVLSSIQAKLLEADRFLTIRRARWIAKLYPLLSPALKNNEFRLLQISGFYSRKEQVAEINGKHYADTSELDRVFITGNDVSFRAILRVWSDVVYLPGIIAEAKKNGKTAPLEAISGKYTAENKELHQWIKFLLSGKQKEAESLLDKHPEIEPLAGKWLVLSTRHEVEAVAREINNRTVRQ